MSGEVLPSHKAQISERKTFTAKTVHPTRAGQGKDIHSARQYVHEM